MPSYPDLTPDAERHFGPAVAHCIALFNQLAAPEAQGTEHAEIEARLREDGNEVLRLGFQGYLDQRSAAEVAEPWITESDGARRTHRLWCRGSASAPSLGGSTA